jgi:hypothetical protein
LKDGGESLARDLEDVVSRALRDNLTPLQRTADELHQACADFVAACGSAKPGNALPALLRAQTAASSLSSALSVLSNFVVISMKPPERQILVTAGTGASVADARQTTPVATASQASSAPAAGVANNENVQPESAWAEEDPQATVEAEARSPEHRPVPHYTEELPLEPEAGIPEAMAQSIEPPVMHETMSEVSFETAVPHHVAPSEAPFDVTGFPPDIQELHRRANRVAKVAMQDIKLLKPQDVQSGRENKDICERLRSELDKARKEYDRRFRAIQDHPVDYFHRWMVEILAEGNAEALGEYPYPSPVLRH